MQSPNNQPKRKQRKLLTSIKETESDEKLINLVGGVLESMSSIS